MHVERKRRSRVGHQGFLELAGSIVAAARDASGVRRVSFLDPVMGSDDRFGYDRRARVRKSRPRASARAGSHVRRTRAISSSNEVKVPSTGRFGYAFAVAAVLVTVLACAAFPSLTARAPLLPLLFPVIVAAAVAGLAPGLLATALACAAALALPMTGRGGGIPAGSAAMFPVLLLAVEGGLASWFIDLRPRAPRFSGREHRDVEAKLRRSEERYRAIVDTQAEMVCRFRPSGEILFVNGGYARARGTTPDALLGTNFWDFIADEDRHGVECMLDLLTPQSPEVRIENRFETAEGVRWTLWTNRALSFDDRGRCTEAQSTGIDITDRKEAEQALRDANQRKTEFLAVLGHELRNPLAPLSAGVELLRQTGRSRESIEDIRAMMKRQLDHLTRLVEDLLDLSRISRGKIALRLRPLDLRHVIDGAVELTLPAIRERGHRLSIETASAPLPVDGDLQRLTQVVANLLGNAAKYTEPGGLIEISAEREGEQGVVRVRDTGFGLPPERLDSLFEMFTQVPEHRARTGGGGLGIGLALSRELVNQHGGSIEAISQGFDCGSEFIVRLPLCDAEPLSAPQPPRASAPAHADSPAQRRILVVDDNEDAAHSLRLVLEYEGHLLQVEHDAQSAIDAVGSFQPQVVLLDIGLPKIDGYEAAKRIRELPEGQHVLLVAVTGWGHSADRERALKSGFDEHLTKPVDWEVLTALIQSHAAAPGVGA
jgi:PAS domain S-box-containing protein